MPVPQSERGVRARGYSPDNNRNELVNYVSVPYQIRLLSGQFDSGKPMNLAEAREGIRLNNPTKAYQRIHEEWGKVRTTEWATDTQRSFKEKRTAWANSRARDLLPRVKPPTPGQSPDQNLINGLRTIGFTQDPQVATLESLTDYFANTFFSEFAAGSDKSVGHLVDTFYEAAKGADGNLTEEEAGRAKAQVQALFPVLRPILKEENYVKFEDVLQARLAAGLGKLKESDAKNKMPPTQKIVSDLAYFLPEQTPYHPAAPTVSRPEPTPTPAAGRPRPVTRTAVPEAAAAAGRPAPEAEEEVVVVETTPEDLFIDIIKGVAEADKTRTDTVLDLPADALFSGDGNLLSIKDGFIQIEVTNPGTVDIDETQNIVRVRGASINIQKGGVERPGVNLDLLLQQGAEGAELAIESIEEDPAYPDWNKQLAQEALAAVIPSFREKVTSDIAHISGWMADSLRIEKGRFRIGFSKEAVVPTSPPPLPQEGEIFPASDDDSAVGSI